MPSPPARLFGIDTGGTFTDLIELDPTGTRPPRAAKVPSTPTDPSRAVLSALHRMDGAAPNDRVVHGTTVALNALLEGRTARTAFITNRGFQDLIEIGRQDRPDLYALHPTKPAPLVPRDLRFEIDERIAPGPRTPDSPRELTTLREPTGAEIQALVQRVRRAQPDSIAVGLLHSYADPAQELRLAEALQALDLPVVSSASLLAEAREFERFSTAIANAALIPKVRAYLENLQRELHGTRLELLQSSGGTLPAERAALEPVRILFSGPAGGVVGAARAADEAGFDALVALDMGGTSTDVAFHDLRGSSLDAGGEDLRVAGHPIGVPSLDIHTVGTGGGSLVRVVHGRLTVGPESAGADPGPVAYGRGETLTVTDAHVFLGHVRSGTFVGGELELDYDRVEKRFASLADQLGVRPKEAAQAVLDVARAAMRRAIGVMTMQRGKDPAQLPLVAFGGAGGLHAAALAQSLGMLGALVPRFPGCLSALGMAVAAPLRDASRSVLEVLEEKSERWSARARKAAFTELEAPHRSELRELHGRAAQETERILDLRYRGQSFVLRLADPGGSPAKVLQAFHEKHEARYGWALPERDVELVTLRSRVALRQERSQPAKARARKLPKSAILEGSGESAPRHSFRGLRIDRDALPEGARFEGPALVLEYSGTTVVPAGWSARVTAGGHLWLESHTSDL